MTELRWGALLLVAVVSAATGAIVATALSSGEDAPPSTPAISWTNEIEALTQRLARLEKRLAEAPPPLQAPVERDSGTARQPVVDARQLGLGLRERSGEDLDPSAVSRGERLALLLL